MPPEWYALARSRVQPLPAYGIPGWQVSNVGWQLLLCRRALDGELYFYGRTLGFPASMPDDLDPIELVNV